MSLLSTKKTYVAIGAGYLVIAQTERGLITQLKTEMFDVADATDAHAALAELDRLQETLSLHGHDVHIRLSSHLAPLLSLPWQSNARADEQQALVASAELSDVYGEPAQQWQVQVQAMGYGLSWLACGIRKPLHDALLERFETYGAKLASITAMAATVLHKAMAAMQGGPCWLLVSEPSHICACLGQAGNIRFIRNFPLAALDRESTGAFLAREAFLSGIELPSAPALLSWGDAQGRGTKMADGWPMGSGVAPAASLYLLGAPA